MLPHLDAAYNLARWLARDDHDAEDIVQETFLRAYRAFDGFHGNEAKPWLLAILRNCFRTAAGKRNTAPLSLDEEMADEDGRTRTRADDLAADGENPEEAMIRASNVKRIEEVLGLLPADYREVLVLREFEDLAYADIAKIIDAPIGTVMSRLARARALIRAHWLARVEGKATP